ncbi:penicillin-binding transpeptidase domain-containing protein [Fluviispira multicolorata]|uniref:Beta-lactamase n=1 Tax=Fluviispira multicolorata TaxID=2654512 RepID=A0A833N5P3_9BACT|nr:penicillin-binding transpeptidase domain-containing protein [Fluviispira multicolorata]KAB8033624.1 hypothetical protein GCL57_02645 [Fluviispira multicolorata]
MKSFFYVLMLSSLTTYAKENINYKDYYKNSQGCFILFDVKKNKIVEEYNEKFCKEQMPPNSTFKIPLSIIGFDKKILKDEKNPEWKFKEEYLTNGFQSWMPVQWKEANTPSSWLKYSVLWYSQELANKIGTESIKGYLNKFDYGNMDFSGKTEKNNVSTIPWVDSSLKISAENQIQFLKNFVLKKLPVSDYSIEMTKKLLLIDQNNSKISLFGKTGAGFMEKRIAHGWFIGWVEKENNSYLFVSRIKDNLSDGELNSVVARENAMKFLQKLDIL